MVLASLPQATAQLHPFDVPRAFWEEQFGMVLAEAMAAGLDILASDERRDPRGARRPAARCSRPATGRRSRALLRDGPLARAAGRAGRVPRELVERYSTRAAAERLAAAYDGLDVRAPVEHVERRQRAVLDVAVAEDRADLAAAGVQVVHLDQQPARRVAVEVQAAQHRRLEALDVERQQVDLGRADLVEDRGQRARGDLLVVLVVPARGRRPGVTQSRSAVCRRGPRRPSTSGRRSACVTVSPSWSNGTSAARTTVARARSRHSPTYRAIGSTRMPLQPRKRSSQYVFDCV